MHINILKRIKHVEWILLSAIVFLGVLLRIIAQSNVLDINPDGVMYIEAASNLKNGIGSFERRGPLFQVLLILIYNIYEVNLQSSIFLSIFFGSINSILFFFIGKHLFNLKTGLIAALLSSINVLSINLSCWVVRENFSLFLILLLIITMNYSFEIQSKKKCYITTILTSLICGLIILTREEMIFIIPFACITYIILLEKKLKDIFIRTIIFIIITTLTITPWLIYSNITFNNPFHSYLYYLKSPISVLGSSFSSQTSAGDRSILTYVEWGIFGLWTEIYTLPNILSIMGFLFLLIGIMYNIKRRDIWIIYLIMIFDLIILSFAMGTPTTREQWSWPHVLWNVSRIPFSAVMPMIVISANGIVQFTIKLLNTGQEQVISILLNNTKRKSYALIITSLFLLGTVDYIPAYVLTLKDLQEKSSIPFIESAAYLNSLGDEEGVFTMHPDMLAKYYDGRIYKIPEKGSFENILEEAIIKGIKYLIIESTCITSNDLIDLYYYSVNQQYRRDGRRLPQEFVLLKARKWDYGIYKLQTQTYLNVAIFTNSRWGDIYSSLIEIFNTMDASTSILDETNSILEIDLSELDLLVFSDYIKPLNDTERLYLKESIETGLKVVVIGTSPFYLAGSAPDLTNISTWFGATVYLEAPKEARYMVKFTDSAMEIMELNLGYEYAFYTSADWSTPIGCVVQPEVVVYAYRVKDEAATIFLNKFGEGKSLYIGPRFGFNSPDKVIFKTFLESLIRFTLYDKT